MPKKTDDVFPKGLYGTQGIDLRTWIATQIFANTVFNGNGYRGVKVNAAEAVKAADDLIEALNK